MRESQDMAKDTARRGGTPHRFVWRRTAVTIERTQRATAQSTHGGAAGDIVGHADFSQAAPLASVDLPETPA